MGVASEHRWRDVLREVAEAHGLYGLTLWSVLVSWMAPEPQEVTP